MKNWSQIIDFESLNYIEVRGSQGFIAGAKFVSENPTMIESVRELVEAAQKVSTINIEYQADKSSGPFDMVYVKWKAERQLREDNLKLALKKLEKDL